MSKCFAVLLMWDVVDTPEGVCFASSPSTWFENYPIDDFLLLKKRCQTLISKFPRLKDSRRLSN